MPAPDTALIVIDIQESVRRRPYYRDADVPVFIDRVQTLADGAKAAGIAVVQIFHVEDSGPFSEGSGFVTTMAPLGPAPRRTPRRCLGAVRPPVTRSSDR